MSASEAALARLLASLSKPRPSVPAASVRRLFGDPRR
jgi:hypothetical protein